MPDIENCKITHYPKEVLAKPAEPVEKNDEQLRKIVDKMTDIMIENKGVGLAAPQANLGLQLFIISLDGTRESVRAYINPTVSPTTDELIATEEGCLSVPGIYTKIRRYKTCSVTATDLDGKEFTEQADGLYAKALQHEYDHLQGLTIINKMGSAAKIAHRKQQKKLAEKKR